MLTTLEEENNVYLPKVKEVEGVVAEGREDEKARLTTKDEKGALAATISCGYPPSPLRPDLTSVPKSLINTGNA